MKERRVITLYRSFAEALEMLNDEDRLAIYDAIVAYGFRKKVPSIYNPTQELVWRLIQPILETDWKKFEGACKGGAPKGNRNAEKTTIG